MEIHQIIPSFAPNDAMCNYTIELRNILYKWGYRSEVFCQNKSRIARYYMDYKKISSKNNILIFHFGTGGGLNNFVNALPDKKILIYHNVTPHSFFSEVNSQIADILKDARNELKSCIPYTDLALGVSEYNRLELAGLGFKNTGVLPFIVDFNRYNINPDNGLFGKYKDDYVNILFVGRIVPNKKQEDIIKTFYCYKKYINPKSRLFLIGHHREAESYHKRILRLIDKLGLEDIYVTGQVGFKDLVTYYKLAHVFLCMSEHEGFCAPLLESMYFKIPILAYNSTAIPYTLKDSGVLINEKKYNEIAELIDLLIKDKDLRKKVVQKQTERLKDFKKEKSEQIFKDYIGMVK